MNIIVVEDEAKTRIGLCSLINNNTEHKILSSCKNGREGLKCIIQNKPDLVITDIRMPDMGGLEMLEKAKLSGSMQKSIILSGYSEFEYAKKAIHLEVEDYILKPVDIIEIKELFNKIEKDICKNKIITKNSEDYLREVILEENVNDINYIFKENKENYIMIIGNLSKCNMKMISRIMQLNKINQNKYKDLEITQIYLSNSNELVILAGGKTTEKLLKELEDRINGFNKSLLSNTIWSYYFYNDIYDTNKVYHKIRKQLRHFLIFTNKKIISENDIKTIDYDKYKYPISCQEEIIKCLLKFDEDGTKEGIEKFNKYIQKHKFNPKNIIQAYIALISSIMKTYAEFAPKAYENITISKYINTINNSFDFVEMKKSINKLVLEFLSNKEENTYLGNYIINKTTLHIKSHYREKIRLSDVANQLAITPEYLSMLFCREMKINFSDFLTEVRINQAKKLLKSTNMKIYQISKEVGYSDSKYFNRVFKEKEGVSPGYYRNRS